MKKRLYFEKSTKELESLFQENKNTPRVLKALTEELKHRKRKAAVQLLEKVTRRLEILNNDANAPKEPEQGVLFEVKKTPPEPVPAVTEEVSFIDTIKKKLLSLIQ